MPKPYATLPDLVKDMAKKAKAEAEKIPANTPERQEYDEKDVAKWGGHS
jgi:hypothetical protein